MIEFEESVLFDDLFVDVDVVADDKEAEDFFILFLTELLLVRE
jgi:hypothetical protein